MNGSGADSAGSPAEELADDNRDGDTMADLVEGDDDADADGTPNWSNLRTRTATGSRIGSRRATERSSSAYPFDTDSDGTADFLDFDSDANCIADALEGEADFELGFAVDALNPDQDDGDGISDEIEGDRRGLRRPRIRTTTATPTTGTAIRTATP